MLCVSTTVQLNIVGYGQVENLETRERKREREREGTPKTEVNVFDRAGHNKAIVL